MKIIKTPQFENDDYLLRIELNNVPTGTTAIDELSKIDQHLADYYEAKREAFLKQDTNPELFLKFVNEKPSLRSLLELEKLDSTIYTVACELQNNKSYFSLLENIKQHLISKPSTRRCVLRFINDYSEYYDSEMVSPSDVTCLSLIHYLQTGPKVVFRASDIKNELLVDILTIFEFFIKPVYEQCEHLEMSIYCSTAQNIDDWGDFISKFDVICTA